MGSDTDFTATGPTFAGFFTDLGADGKPTMAFGGLATGETIGLLGFANTLGPNQQNTYSFRAGVEGSSDDSTGVAGVSLRHPGVFGQVEDSPLVPNGWLAGVLGVASTQPGVIGYARDGDGTQGLSFTGTAVRAVSFFGPGVQSISGALTGVIGTSELDTGVRGVSGTQGPTPVAGLPTIAGVLGTSDAQAGVIGTSNRTAGVLGFSNNVGVYGEGRQLCGDIQGQRVDHRRPDPAGRYRGGQNQECHRALSRWLQARAPLHGEPRALVRGLWRSEAQARARDGQARCRLRQGDQARRL